MVDRGPVPVASWHVRSPVGPWAEVREMGLWAFPYEHCCPDICLSLFGAIRKCPSLSFVPSYLICLPPPGLLVLWRLWLQLKLAASGSPFAGLFRMPLTKTTNSGGNVNKDKHFFSRADAGPEELL